MRILHRFGLPALLAGAGLLGCGDPPGEDRPAPVRLVEIATVGCLECEGAEAFSLVSAAFVEADTILVVVDGADPRVREFDLDGTPVATWGRTGEGPREFDSFVAAVPTPDGGVLGLSHRPREVFPDERPYLRRDYLDSGFPRSNWTFFISSSPSGRWLSRVGSVGRGEDEYIAVQVVDLELSTATPYPVPDELFDPNDPGSRNAFWVTPAARDDGAFALIGDLDYEILLFGADGELLERAARGTPRIPRTAEEIEAAERRSLPIPMPNGIEPPKRDVARYRSQVAGTAFFDAQDRLWVLRSDGRLDLFDPELAYLGTLPERLPRTARLWSNGELVVRVHGGEFDEAYATLYRIEDLGYEPS